MLVDVVDANGKLSLPAIKAGEAADNIQGLVVLSGGKIGLKEDDDGIYRHKKKVTSERERTIIAVPVVCTLLGTTIVVFGAYCWRRKRIAIIMGNEEVVASIPAIIEGAMETFVQSARRC